MGTAFPDTDQNLKQPSACKNHRFGGPSDPKDGLQLCVPVRIRVPLLPSSASPSEAADVISASPRVSRVKLSDASTFGLIDPTASSGSKSFAECKSSSRTSTWSAV